MRLRPSVIDEMFHPGTFPSFVFPLLIPEDSILMSQAGHQIRDAVAVDILRVNKAGAAEVELRMEYPFSLSRIRWGFKPALRSDNVRAAIPIHIACSDTVPKAIGTDFML